MMSQTAQKMILDRKGYRTESFRGSGIKDLKKIVSFEIIELENIDIPLSMFLLYNDFELPSVEIYSEEHLEEVYASCDTDDGFNKKIVKDVVNYVCEKLNKNKSDITTVWLSTLKNVKKYYCDDSGYPKNYLFHNYFIDKYKIKQPFIILSDLDDEGVLFAF